eukprot:TRINITY_DN12416_c4_g8_i2.p1 TRINITY_DN12416_c4_g8~~TRINITY_DN12416_c4_g8_i2.p1  ORF type:complete len:1006 (+),score=197.35 TRINITY_DN12416_c4_g8_i2:361-3018(+)
MENSVRRKAPGPPPGRRTSAISTSSSTSRGSIDISAPMPVRSATSGASPQPIMEEDDEVFDEVDDHSTATNTPVSSATTTSSASDSKLAKALSQRLASKPVTCSSTKPSPHQPTASQPPNLIVGTPQLSGAPALHGMSSLLLRNSAGPSPTPSEEAPPLTLASHKIAAAAGPKLIMSNGSFRRTNSDAASPGGSRKGSIGRRPLLKRGSSGGLGASSMSVVVDTRPKVETAVVNAQPAKPVLNLTSSLLTREETDVDSLDQAPPTTLRATALPPSLIDSQADSNSSLLSLSLAAECRSGAPPPKPKPANPPPVASKPGSGMIRRGTLTKLSDGTTVQRSVPPPAAPKPKPSAKVPETTANANSTGSLSHLSPTTTSSSLLSLSSNASAPIAPKPVTPDADDIARTAPPQPPTMVSNPVQPPANIKQSAFGSASPIPAAEPTTEQPEGLDLASFATVMQAAHAIEDVELDDPNDISDLDVLSMRPPVTLSTVASDESLAPPRSPMSPAHQPPAPRPVSIHDLPPPPEDDLPPPVMDDLPPPPVEDLPPPSLDVLPPPPSSTSNAAATVAAGPSPPLAAPAIAVNAVDVSERHSDNCDSDDNDDDNEPPPGSLAAQLKAKAMQFRSRSSKLLDPPVSTSTPLQQGAISAGGPPPPPPPLPDMSMIASSPSASPVSAQAAGIPPPPPMMASTGGSAPPPPPPPSSMIAPSPTGSEAPPPPPPPLAKSSSQPRVFVRGRSRDQLLPPKDENRVGLLAALQGESARAALKKAAPAPEKPKDTRDSLLDALRNPNARARLRKVSSADESSDGDATLDPHSALMASLGGLGRGRKSLRRVNKSSQEERAQKAGNRNSITTALFNAMDARRGAISDSEAEDGSDDDDDDDWEA